VARGLRTGIKMIVLIGLIGIWPIWTGAPRAEEAGAPRIVVDIAPVHALVAEVMEGVAEPALLLPPGTSPHAAVLRPSQARDLAEADLLIWIGPTLTPWLGAAVARVAGGDRLDLLSVDGTVLYPLRDLADGGAPAPGGPADPHAWLDPVNARVWVRRVAEELAAIDPDHAPLYLANAERVEARLLALEAEISGQLKPLQGVPFVVQHDAYQYFEARFGLQAAGSVQIRPGQGPGPAHLRELGRMAAVQGARCAFSEPQFDDRLLQVLADADGMTVIDLDPLGVESDEGYDGVLRAMAAAIASCLSE
jgi:zinc transport system substrate-binding protein